MSDGIGGSAPAAASTQGPSGSSGTPSTPNGATGPQNPAKPAGTPPRVNGGRFGPKDGAAAAQQSTPEPKAPDATPGGQPPAKPPEPEWRFKEKGKVFGKEEDWDFSREDVKRLVQKGRAFELRGAELNKQQQQAARLFELAKADPDAFLREAGHDPVEHARKRLASEAKLAAMDEHERAVYERDRQIQQLQQQLQQREEAGKKFQQQARTEALKKQTEARFIGALDKSNLEKTHETLYLMAETADILYDQLGPKGFADITDEDLARETEHRLHKMTSTYLSNLEGPQLLKRLGPDVVARVLSAKVAEFDASQNFEPAHQEPPPQPAGEGRREFLDFAEVRRRLRQG